MDAVGADVGWCVGVGLPVLAVAEDAFAGDHQNGNPSCWLVGGVGK